MMRRRRRRSIFLSSLRILLEVILAKSHGLRCVLTLEGSWRHGYRLFPQLLQVSLVLMIFYFLLKTSFSFLTIVLCVREVSCSVTGNNQCTLFSGQITGWDSNTESQEDYYNATGRRFEPIGVSYGLYLYGVERFNEANEIYIANCEPYPSFAVNDNYVKSARAFSALALIIGFPIMFLLCLTPCMKFGARFLRVMSSFLMLVAICEALVFLFLSSARCLATPNPIEPIPLQSQLVWAKCTLGNGSKLVIVSVVMWCMTSITLGCSSRLSLVESRLKFASMHIPAMTATEGC